MARQIGHEHAVTLGKQGRESAPVLDDPAEPVHEHERRAGSTDDIVEPCSVPFELSFLESLESVFALRHQRGIFFVPMNASAGRAE